MLGKIEGKRIRGWHKMRWVDSIIDLIYINLRKVWEVVEDRGAWQAAIHGIAKNGTWLND